MKKLLLLVLALIVAFSTTACVGGENATEKGSTLKWTDDVGTMRETSFHFTKTDDEKGILEYTDSYTYSNTSYVGLTEKPGDLKYTISCSADVTYSVDEDGTYSVGWYYYNTTDQLQLHSMKMEISGSAKKAYIESVLEYYDTPAMEKLVDGKTLTDTDEILSTSFFSGLDQLYVTFTAENDEFVATSCGFSFYYPTGAGSVTVYYDLKYNDDGKLICKYNYCGNRTLMEYGEDGTMEKMTTYWDNWKRVKSVSIGSYDWPYGFKDGECYYSMDGTFMGSSKTTYDDSGFFSETQYYDDSGALIGKCVLVDDEYQYFTAEGTKVERSELIYRDVRDDNGNIIQRAYYDTYDFVPLRTIIYDENGNTVQTQEYSWYDSGMRIDCYDAENRQIALEVYSGILELKSKSYFCFDGDGREIGDINYEYVEGHLYSSRYYRYDGNERVEVESQYGENWEITGNVYYLENELGTQEIDAETFENLEWVVALKAVAGIE